MGLDPVVVRIDDEGGVVAWRVIGAQSWRSVIHAAEAERGGTEGVDAVARRGGEADVQAGFFVGRRWVGRGWTVGSR